MAIEIKMKLPVKKKVKKALEEPEFEEEALVVLAGSINPVQCINSEMILGMDIKSTLLKPIETKSPKKKNTPAKSKNEKK